RSVSIVPVAVMTAAQRNGIVVAAPLPETSFAGVVRLHAPAATGTQRRHHRHPRSGAAWQRAHDLEVGTVALGASAKTVASRLDGHSSLQRGLRLQHLTSSEHRPSPLLMSDVRDIANPSVPARPARPASIIAQRGAAFQA